MKLSTFLMMGIACFSSVETNAFLTAANNNPTGSRIAGAASTRKSVVSGRTHAETSTSLHALTKKTRAVTLAGNIWPAVQKFKIGPTKAKEIVRAIIAVTHREDVLLFFFFAFLGRPLAKFIFERSEQFEGMTEKERKRKPLYILKQFGVTNIITQIARIELSVYAADVIKTTLSTIGFQCANAWSVTNFAKTIYTVWVVKKFLAFKQILLCRINKVSIDDMGRVELLDKIINGVTVAIAALLLLDFLAIKTGKALSGVFAFGSIGTLAFTLASQGLVKELLSGFALNFSDKMYVGDNVKFGDGTSGKVIKLGWMETILKGSDDIHQSVPNGAIQGQKMSNLSRLTRCQVAQTLRFDYADADKIPDILDSIRSEIKRSCPKVITDSTSPFRVFLTNFNEDHLEVMVDTHYRIAPIGDAYWINRQNVLQAIMRAVKSHNVEFATLCVAPTFDSGTEW
eukprot:CAMPEP_0198288990 /NCGR_PEP_ID=MMETSP1449-20131203/7327_1 /TAXON_ID=420275 /ORGANISM="Attheya septentrionalis, Strain CCMP2084" /LENGTH=455 /DNA_ID=CAMNT_0043987243 /DNA_START=159 /DNA_END=1523 /DNA_ORIENTATION=+